MEKAYINDSCNECLVCIDVCPVKAIEVRDDKPVIVKMQCEGCGACVDECSVEAIEMREE